MFTDSCGRVGPYLQITGSVQHIVNLLTKLIHNRQKMTEKHRSVNNVLWRVVAGRIRRGRGPDAASWTPLINLFTDKETRNGSISLFNFDTISIHLKKYPDIDINIDI